MTASCQDCGADITADATFCESCGKRLTSPSPASPAAPPPPPPVFAPPAAPPPPVPMPVVSPLPSPIAPRTWYLNSATWLALAVFVLVVLGIATVIRAHSPQPASGAGGRAPIAGDLSDASITTATPGSDPAAGNPERSGAEKLAAGGDNTPTGAPVPDGVQPYLGRWKIIAGETELPEDERYLEFVTQGEQVVAEVPALSARFEFAYDSSNGSLIGTFSDAKSTVSSSAEFDAANNCLHICIGLERSEPMLMTAVPAK